MQRSLLGWMEKESMPDSPSLTTSSQHSILNTHGLLSKCRFPSCICCWICNSQFYHHEIFHRTEVYSTASFFVSWVSVMLTSTAVLPVALLSGQFHMPWRNSTGSGLGLLRFGFPNAPQPRPSYLICQDFFPFFSFCAQLGIREPNTWDHSRD